MTSSHTISHLILSPQLRSGAAHGTMNIVSLAAGLRRETVWPLDPLVHLVARS